MSGETPQQLKQRLRATLKQRRQALSDELRQRLNGQICGHLLRWLSGRQEQHIAAYWPVRGEADLRPALTQLTASGRELYLPRVDPQISGAMDFVAWRGDMTPEQLNRYGIPEPDSAQPGMTAAAMDIVLMPLLGYCPRGGRLGAGAGYYDRALADLPQPRPWLIGIAYSLQQLEGLPQEPWDIPLDAVFTERGLQVCDPRQSDALCATDLDQESAEWPIG
ncbi:MAG: 5-formyltetrahydrofolate cyclo-ligase [Wenzhouxiangellaceae bacterium]